MNGDFVVISPRRPTNDNWAQQPMTPFLATHLAAGAELWVHPEGFAVISAVEAPDADTIGPEYHLSISKNGGRCDSLEALQILLEFDADGALEDNHVGGITRNFWRPVADNMVGYVCPCQRTEVAITENKGDYVWRPAPNSHQAK